VTAVERGVGDFVEEAKQVLGATEEEIDGDSIPF
jgi:hypothetical protein